MAASAQDLALVFNCGSSSIKFALFDLAQQPVSRSPVVKGKIDGIGGASACFMMGDGAPQRPDLDQAQPYHAALELIRHRVREHLSGRRIAVVAHRVVHGGSKYSEPVRVDGQVLGDLRSYIPLAPLHQPFALDAIEVMLADPHPLPQVACFDTGFHHTLPQAERTLPLPHEWAERGLVRYGFHGLSYEYMSVALPGRHGDIARQRLVVAHLGSGASLCAMEALRSQATTMGFSALDGLMMGTRCGALDPGALLYLMQVKQLDVDQVGDLLYHHAGLLGVSGSGSDPRDLLAREAHDPRARLALDMYVRRAAREIAGLATALGGLDMLAFTGGIGEHNADIRQRICQRLRFLGVELDMDANAAHAACISAPASRVRVAVEATNEEWIAARAAQSLYRRPERSTN